MHNTVYLFIRSRSTEGSEIYEWKGQPKRHLLTTGWSVFVSAKGLIAGDSVLFIWNENNQLLLGIRRASRPQTVMPSSFLSSDRMHIGLLAAAAHAAATISRFTIFYNPRASPSEFVIPLASYMGTITGISDLESARWPNSHWRSVKVGWDESTSGKRQPRVSLWEIEPLTTFPMYPSPFPLRLKRPWPLGLASLHGGNDDEIGLNPLSWLQNSDRGMQTLNFQGLGMAPWMQPRFDASMFGLQPDMYQAMAAAALQEIRTVDPSKPARQNLQQMQPQSQQAILQSLQDGQPQNQTQAHFLKQQLQHCQQQLQSPQSSQQQQQQRHQHQLQQQQQLQHHHHQQQQQLQQQSQHLQHQHHQHSQQQQPTHQPISNVASALSPLTSTSQSQASTLPIIPSFCQQNFPDINGNPISTSGVSPLHSVLRSFSPEETSNILGIPRSSPLVNSGVWPSKRLAVESILSSGTQAVQSQVEQLTPHGNIAQHSFSLPPFPGRECSLDQEGHRSVGSETDSTAMPFATGNFLSTRGTDFPLNQVLPSSSCLEDSGFLQSPENVGQVNPRNGRFVKGSSLQNDALSYFLKNSI